MEGSDMAIKIVPASCREVFHFSTWEFRRQKPLIALIAALSFVLTLPLRWLRS